MKVFMVGDFLSNNGPANANRTICVAVQRNEDVRFSKATNKLLRVVELLFQMIWCEACIICSASELNYIVLKLSKILNKKVLMVIHGSRPLEYIINGGQKNNPKYKEHINYEQTMISQVDKVFCVSKMFCDYMKRIYSSYSDKIDFINNIVDVSSFLNRTEEKRKNVIISTGGGMRNKRNLIVAQAIEQLNQSGEKEYRYIVIGKEANDGASIKKYGFVTYYESLPHEEVLRLMGKASLYVQNSEYDTFGLAVLEAFGAGASLLISQHVGCKGVFRQMLSEDIIEHVDDVNEVAEKIENLMEHPNHKRLAKEFQEFDISEEFVASKISRLLREK